MAVSAATPDVAAPNLQPGLVSVLQHVGCRGEREITPVDDSAISLDGGWTSRAFDLVNSISNRRRHVRTSQRHNLLPLFDPWA